MKFLRYIPIVCIALLSFLACQKNFLERQPQGTLSEATLTTAAGVNALLIGAYAALDGQQNNNGAVNSLGGGNSWASSPTNWVWGSMGRWRRSQRK